MEIGRLLTIRRFAIIGFAVGVFTPSANQAFGNPPIGNNPPITNPQSTIDRLVAVVGGEPIFLSDVREVVRLRLLDPAGSLAGMGSEAGATVEDRALARLIDRRLVLAEVDRYSQAPPPAADVDAMVEVWRARLDPVPAYDAAFVRAFLSDTLRIDRYIDQRFTAAALPTREEARAFYKGEQPFETVEDEVRKQFAEERRRTMVREWLRGLRERAQVRVLR